jgi:hypothetical protein
LSTVNIPARSPRFRFRFPVGSADSRFRFPVGSADSRFRFPFYDRTEKALQQEF